MGTMPKVRPPSLDATATTVTALTTQVKRMPAPVKITDADTLQVVHNQQLALHNLAKEVKEKKEAITKPLNAALKATRELFAPLEEMLEEGISERKLAIGNYNREVERRLAAMRERLEDKVEEGEIEPEAAGSRVARAAARMGAAHIPTRTRKVVVVDDESKIPRAYFDLNMARLNQAVLKEGVKVAGCHVEEVTDIVNR